MSANPAIAAVTGAVAFPAVIVCDSREGLPYSFCDIKADSDKGYKTYQVSTIIKGLPSGDYSLEGMETRIAIERKSCSDLFSTIGQGRKRFERELARLASYDFSAVVVEADWPTILGSPPERSQLSPKVVYRSILAWQQRFPVTHWILCPDRRFGEVTTFRILERFWRDEVEGKRRLGGFGVWKAKERAKEELADVEWMEEVEREEQEGKGEGEAS